MKEAISIILILCVVFLFSCKKDYHCSCSFNNNVVYSKDLGTQTRSNAQNTCSSYDTMYTGEVWNCTIY